MIERVSSENHLPAGGSTCEVTTEWQRGNRSKKNASGLIQSRRHGVVAFDLIQLLSRRGGLWTSIGLEFRHIAYVTRKLQWARNTIIFENGMEQILKPEGECTEV